MSRSIRHGSLWPAQRESCCLLTLVPALCPHPYRSLYDLRYMAAELVLAATEGRRPMPQKIRPGTDNPCSRGECSDSGSRNRAYAAAQRGMRASQRAALGELRKVVNGGAEPDDPGFGERANGRRAAW